MKVKTFAVLFLSVLFTSPAFAAEKEPHKAAMPEPSREQRNAMAAANEKMAACLRSDRKIATCRDEMMEACHKTLGKNGCPVFGPPAGK